MAAALGSVKDREFKKFVEIDPARSAVRITGDPDADPVPVTLTTGASSSSPAIYNVTCTLADTEYSQSLTNGTNQFIIRARNTAKLQLAFSTGQTDTTYVTIYPGSSFKTQNLNTNNLTLYFEASKPNTIVEIIEWS